MSLRQQVNSRGLLIGLVTVCIVLIAGVLLLQEQPGLESQAAIEAPVDPLAKDFFFMRNPEIREDLLEQLSLHEVEHWVNEDGSIGHFMKDTREVNRIAREAIAVWITSQ